jgi:hypothetical protein
LKERCGLEACTNFFSFKKVAKTKCGLDSRIYGIYRRQADYTALQPQLYKRLHQQFPQISKYPPPLETAAEEQLLQLNITATRRLCVAQLHNSLMWRLLEYILNSFITASFVDYVNYLKLSLHFQIYRVRQATFLF